jgi:hypothetical protein
MAKPSSNKATRRKSSETDENASGHAESESQERRFPPSPRKPNKPLLAISILILAVWLILLLLLALFG